MTEMYRLSFTVVGILLFSNILSTISCLGEMIDTWTLDQPGYQLTDMLLSKYGGHVVVSGTNMVYNINASNLELLNSARTGPYNASVDDTVKLMVNNHSYSGVEYVTTCSSTHNNCSVRHMINITNIERQLPSKYVKNINGVQAFIVDSLRESGPVTEHDSYLFVGCPHFKDQNKFEGLCKKPGISWYKNNGLEENDGDASQSFKEKAEVKTEKFVAAFPVEKLRIFFSIQKLINGSKISRISQVCQYYYPVNNEYTTPFTYVDMPITCGEFQEVLEVNKVTVDGSIILVAIFTDNMKSAVCIYNMSHVNKTFVDNVKKCYRTVWPPDPIPDWYYFRYANQVPCRQKWPEGIPLPTNDEVLLCNTDKLPQYHHMIGDIKLSKDPVLILNETVTSLTTTTEKTNVIAFLGTKDGFILKTNVYPESTAGVINQPDLYKYGSNIKTMLTSPEQEHLYVLTDHKLYKVPVESCADFQSCGECLASHDPYCGWCMLENRCSTNATCPDTDVWFPTLNPDSQCLSVVSVEPSVVSGRVNHMLEIEVSHKIQAVNISCVFDFEQFTRSHTSPVSLMDDGYTTRCNTTFILEELHAIQGSINVTVSIVTSMSDRPILTSYLTVYNCETFYSCSQCTEIEGECLWNTADANCVYNTGPSNAISASNTSVSDLEKCPRALNYTLTASDGTMLDNVDGSWYLSGIDGHYNLTMTGTNLPAAETISYSCKMLIGTANVTWFTGTRVSPDEVTCEIKMDNHQVLPPYNDLNGTIQVMRGSSVIAGEPLIAVIYTCRKASDNCGLCKSFDLSQPHYLCKWCGSACVHKQTVCNDTDLVCPNPDITHVYPLSVAVNATGVEIDIEGKNLGSEYSDTINAVTVAGRKCESIEDLYDPGKRIVCTLEGSNTIENGKVRVILNNSASGEYFDVFSFRLPVIKSVEPVLGPNAGGTLITIHGTFLDTGRQRNILVDRISCSETSIEMTTSPTLLCQTPARNDTGGNSTVSVSIDYDGVMIDGKDDVDFTYVPDPNITSISPLKSFMSGGRNLTISGTNLYAIQKPTIYAEFDEFGTDYQNCDRIGSENLICPSPRFEHGNHNGMRRNSNTQTSKLGFIMDNVSSVLAENLPDTVAVIHYYPDPVLYNLTKTRDLKEIQENDLVISGNYLDVAAFEEDVTVMIGCFKCNVTAFTADTILCKPPPVIPECNDPNINAFTVQVQIGYFKRNVGEIRYTPVKQTTSLGVIEKYVISAVMGVLVLCLIAAGIIVGVMMKKKRNMKREIVIKLDKLEANFRNQCREEFVNLQTAVSDLTSDLEGGSVLFREYSMYAAKTLFISQKNDTLKQPPTALSEQKEKAMEAFKGLLLNFQFLSMFIKTLEKQRSFTIYDTSDVATILMTLNHDNMEYITGVLSHLLNDLVDKNMESGTPKLMLRRSESVAEKLLTHWLSICLYHHLKGKTGSSLYILYKAIKIQTEKGPIDYMTNCGKYTLSEEKLFTFGDRDIKPVTLALRVNHFDYIDNKEKQITVNVLDCDTITQTKSKMLDIIYKNVPYSQRPSVHSTTLVVDKSSIGRTFDEEVQSDDTGIKRYLNDEDESSVKEGSWSRINTLQHYNIKDGTAVFLYLNKDLEQSFKSLGEESPESYIVGTLQKSKFAVKTISGCNMWHLTKEHTTDDDVRPGSDVFLPRLTTTKMTIQPYIEELFTSLLSVDDEPPIIIKYLFDFLDMAASRRGVTDPDVVHTWKCNSLLLRFWVNIVKNPEFVFDVHKPLLVDSCLSVVAQTLMDSCSTADLVLNKSSPSNKLLFAKEIPRYKIMVKEYFQKMKEKPAVSDQDLNSYLTQKVSQKFSGVFYTQSALMQMFNYAVAYKTELCLAMDDLEDSSPGVYTPLLSKLQTIFSTMNKS